MESFIIWLFLNFSSIINELTANTVIMIDSAYELIATEWSTLADLGFKLVIFSDTPILDMNLYDFLLFAFSLFYTIIFIVIVWKIIKKVFVKITRWDKW